MTPQNHNKIIGGVYGLIGLLILIGLIVATGQEMHKHVSTGRGQAFPWELSLLPLPLLHLLTSYGLFRKRRWARILALIFSVLYVWVFPLGTAIVIYTWYVLHRDDVKQLYSTPGA